jgi:hypothetical protein
VVDDDTGPDDADAYRMAAPVGPRCLQADAVHRAGAASLRRVTRIIALAVASCSRDLPNQIAVQDEEIHLRLQKVIERIAGSIDDGPPMKIERGIDDDAETGKTLELGKDPIKRRVISRGQELGSRRSVNMNCARQMTPELLAHLEGTRHVPIQVCMLEEPLLLLLEDRRTERLKQRPLLDHGVDAVSGLR